MNSSPVIVSFSHRYMASLSRTSAVFFQELLRFFMLFFHNRNYFFIDLFLRFC